MSKLFIGTSGWNYSHWQEVFYPNTQFFNSVELNVTFYRLVQKEKLAAILWQLPPSFKKEPQALRNIF